MSEQKIQELKIRIKDEEMQLAKFEEEIEEHNYQLLADDENEEYRNRCQSIYKSKMQLAEEIRNIV